MDTNIETVERAAIDEIASAADQKTVDELTVRFIGRKGIVTQMLRAVATLPIEKRPSAGKRTNEAKRAIESALAARVAALKAESEKHRCIDVSLPGRAAPFGYRHPITTITNEICAIFTHMGFTVAEGPEVETDHYNFAALNIPKDHPARDMQDTFYVSDNIVLRTHTSPTQPRVMEKTKPPVRIIAPGKVYRRDSDLTHTPMFHQVEGLLVDQQVSFGDLKGVLTTFVQRMFDARTSLRFRPSFFPFTEPSAEVDILCVMCRGKGCRVCSQSGWLEVLGSGMVHPAVFENVGYDTREYTGFAFGMGVERIAMLKYGIDDIRKFFENDMRFLRQF